MKKYLPIVQVVKKYLVRIIYKMALCGINVQKCDLSGQTALVLAGLPLEELSKVPGLSMFTEFDLASSGESSPSVEENSADGSDEEENEGSVTPERRCSSVQMVRETRKIEHRLRPESAFSVSKNSRKNFIPDQHLITHLLRIGSDSTIGTRDGYFMAVEKYVPRGLYRLQHFRSSIPERSKMENMAGLWPLLDLTLKDVLENKDPEIALAKLQSKLEKHKYWLRGMNRGQPSAYVFVISHLDEKTCSHHETRVHMKKFAAIVQNFLSQSEFALATMANDLECMKKHLAMGQGASKCRMTLDSHFIGFTPGKLTAQFGSRPLLVMALEHCDSLIVQLLLDYGARPDEHFSEKDFSGPVIHWVRHPQVPVDNLFTVVHHEARLKDCRDHKGRTLLIALAERLRWHNRNWPLADDSLRWFSRAVAALLDENCNIAAKSSYQTISARQISTLDENDANLKVIYQELDRMSHESGIGDLPCVKVGVLLVYASIFSIVKIIPLIRTRSSSRFWIILV
ncbi:hypothetical protein Ciccas_005194 [Cichlidogyrus casuarinus]|uniref:Uncharacterized protein n=1 Tax=Cichlidogyrus casuarinus TaxID=1844966 RepID=A0ABD2QBM9_9PLAT